MEVEIGHKMLFVEAVRPCGKGLRNVVVGHVLADDAAILCLCKTIVVAVSRPTFGLADPKLVQQFCHRLVDVLGSIVGVEVSDDEREGSHSFFHRRNQTGFGDGLHGDDDLPLCDLIDHVDVVEPFTSIAITLMHGVHPNEPGHAVRCRFASFPNRHLYRLCLANGYGVLAIAFALSQAVEMSDRDLRQPLETDIAVTQHLGANFLRSDSVEPAVEVVRFSQKFTISSREDGCEPVTILP